MITPYMGVKWALNGYFIGIVPRELGLKRGVLGLFLQINAVF
jgi:hypothetical protein